jgi:hypothetical protein
MTTPTYQAALAYHPAGICCIPILRDGSKVPPIDWGKYTTEMPTLADLKEWFGGANPYGIATVGGAVSGGLEHLDFDVDASTIFPAWCALVEAEAPGVLDRLNFVVTPRIDGGWHVRYRCYQVPIPGNQKIAKKAAPDPKRPGKEMLVTLIETRGEGGYALAPGSPLSCHDSGRPYTHFRGVRLSRIGVITAAEREVLFRCAASFDREPELRGDDRPRPRKRVEPATGDNLRPGDDFNARGCWEDILTGWRCVRKSGEVCYWARPGKKGRGWSATTGHCTNEHGHDLLAVFSSNASPFEGPRGDRLCSCYTRFSAYTLLHHDGRFADAARELASRGYGTQRQSKRRRGHKCVILTASVEIR